MGRERAISRVGEGVWGDTETGEKDEGVIPAIDFTFGKVCLLGKLSVLRTPPLLGNKPTTPGGVPSLIREEKLLLLLYWLSVPTKPS